MRPRFSILTPVHDPPIPALRACLASLARQSFADLEVCLVDDGSTDAAVRAELRDAVAADERFQLLERPLGGGIVPASNDALAMAAGEFVVLVDHDDRLEPHALAVVDAALRAHDDIDYVYTDEDKLTADGTIRDVYLKPDWSPERLRSHNYCTHLSVLRRRLVVDVGQFRPGFDGSQDHDLILRVTERARRVHHVPEVLYHWCITPGSAAGDAAGAAAAKPYAMEAGRRAVADHVSRLGIDATVEHLPTRGHYRVRRARPSPAPPVSVVIATRGAVAPVWGPVRPLVIGAVRSVLAVTDRPDVDVVVVADPATPAAIVAELGALGARVVTADQPSNRAAMCDQGIRTSGGELIVLLDDGALAEQPDWIDVLLGPLTEPDVGVVGARLLAADGTLDHGGILLNGGPRPIFQGFAGDDPGAFGLLEIDREVGAVSARCLATRRDVYDEVGGLDGAFATAHHDVDYCLRVRRTGRRVVWTAHATLYRFTADGDGDGDCGGGGTEAARDLALLRERWGTALDRDPYGNPQLAPGQAVWLSADRATTAGLMRSAWRRLRFVGRT